jgi:transglutaminase-like putative cysteine protease
MLHATMSGIPDRRLLISDSRQREKVVGGDTPPLSVDLVVNSETPSKANTIKLPILDPALAAYLKKESYLNTEDENLRKTALRLRGSETDAFKVALAIRDWVHQNMTPDASIGVPRSASDVFSRRRGVCRDYATLYAALARIAGVPTRLCAGVVYADMDGHAAFFYHAWAESYVATGQWVAVDPTLYDPTLGIDYVDATHIKFAQGDVTQMYDATSVVGKLKITIQ